MTGLLPWVSRLIREYIHDIGEEDLEGLLGVLGGVGIIIAGIIYFVLQRKKIRWW